MSKVGLGSGATSDESPLVVASRAKNQVKRYFIDLTYTAMFRYLDEVKSHSYGYSGENAPLEIFHRLLDNLSDEEVTRLSEVQARMRGCVIEDKGYLINTTSLPAVEDKGYLINTTSLPAVEDFINNIVEVLKSGAPIIKHTETGGGTSYKIDAKMNPQELANKILGVVRNFNPEESIAKAFDKKFAAAQTKSTVAWLADLVGGEKSAEQTFAAVAEERTKARKAGEAKRTPGFFG